jgi:hypothetical protein
MIPQTPDAPIRQNILSTSTHKASKMAEASAKDVMLNVTSTGGSENIVLGGSSASKGAMAEDTGDTSKWKKSGCSLSS